MLIKTQNLRYQFRNAGIFPKIQSLQIYPRSKIMQSSYLHHTLRLNWIQRRVIDGQKALDFAVLIIAWLVPNAGGEWARDSHFVN